MLDRTKEPGAAGEPLYQDVVTALAEGWSERGRQWPVPKVIGGRYGLSSKEFTPAMVAGVFDELAKPAAQAALHRRHRRRRDAPEPRLRSRLLDRGGRRAPGPCSSAWAATARSSANRNSVKIVGENTPLHAQGYFVYDSRKAGSVTTSHVRFSPRPIKGSYLVPPGELRGLPPVPLPRADRHALDGRARGDVPA